MDSHTSIHYPWTRLWYPADETLKYDSDGFVADPEAEYGNFLNPGLHPLESLQEERCLILLGEPGLGKTEALYDHFKTFDSAKASNTVVRWIDLKDIPDAFALTRQLFDSALFKEWEHGTGKLYLFMDSLDEGLLSFDTLTGFIAQELNRLARPQAVNIAQTTGATPVPTETPQMNTADAAPNVALDRLYLRIACRSGIWRSGFSKELGSIFQPARMIILKLAPLTRKEVQLAADQTGTVGFVEQVVARNVTPFAIKPFTLTALLSLFHQHRALPPKKLTIYEEVCRVACVEHNESRKDKLRVGCLSPEERLTIARRIAALTIFCNKTYLRTDLPFENVKPEEFGIDVLYGDEDNVRIDLANLRETLDTGLFAWGTDQRVGWDHRMFAEFLAAQYCKRNNLTIRDVRKLVFVKSSGKKRTAPQLSETVAWLCLFYPSLVKDVLANDPMALIESDVLKDDEGIRYSATERYLLRFEREETFDDQLQEELALLSHKRLLDQLRPYITNKKKKFRARTRAMDIAAACGVHELEIYLVRVAHDYEEPVALRTHALVVLGNSGTPESKKRLRDLITASSEDDPHSEIKGWALAATWPDYISVVELFSVLSDPGDTGFYGGYSSFLYSVTKTLPARLGGDDLMTALSWVESVGLSSRPYDRFQAIIDCVLLCAWGQFDEPGVREPFARLALNRIQSHLPIAEGSLTSRGEHGLPFYHLFSEDPPKRRRLIKALIKLLQADKSSLGAFWLLYTDDKVVRAEDAGWLIEQFQIVPSNERESILQMLERMRDSESLYPIREALDAGILPETLRHLVFIELSSSLAATLREQYEMESKYKQPRSLLKPSPAERIDTYLEMIGAGQVMAWSNLTLALTLEADSQRYGEEGSDLRKLPGWLASDQSTRQAIIDAAKLFLLHFTPTPDDYWQQTFGHWVIAAYLAFVLLREEDFGFFEAQQEDFWSRWSGLLIGYKFDYGKEINKDLLVVIAKKYPDALVKGLTEVLVPERTDCNFLYRIDGAWIPQVEQTLVSILNASTLNEGCNETILNILLQNGSKDAEAIAESMLLQTEDSPKRIIAAVTLLRSSTDGGQRLVWPLIQSSDTIGKEIVERVSEFGLSVELTSKWSESALGDLFVWLAKRYPYEQDRKPGGGAYSVTISDSVRSMRDAVINALRNRGTTEAIAALDQAKNELGADWIKWHIAEARGIELWNSWKPIEPADLLALVDKKPQLPSRWQALTAGLIGYIVNLATPATANVPVRFFLASSAGFLILGLSDLTNREKQFYSTLWFLLSAASLLALSFYYLIGF
jgi:hypothetical protein